jgi:hypothetical protein
MSTEVAPPPYTPSDIVRVIKGLTDKSAVTIDIATSKPSDEEVIKQIEENLDPLRLALSDGVEYEKMEKETRSLSQHVFAIQADFIKIRDILREFDAKNYKDKDNNVIALESKWTPFQEVRLYFVSVYTDADLDGRGSGSSSGTHGTWPPTARLPVIVSDWSLPPYTPLIQLQSSFACICTCSMIQPLHSSTKRPSFRLSLKLVAHAPSRCLTNRTLKSQEMSKFKGEAQTTTDAFIHLRDDISTFVQSLDAYIALAQKGLDVDIDRLQGEINKLNEQIATFVLFFIFKYLWLTRRNAAGRQMFVYDALGSPSVLTTSADQPMRRYHQFHWRWYWHGWLGGCWYSCAVHSLWCLSGFIHVYSSCYHSRLTKVTYAALKAKAKREEAARKQEARNEMNTAQQKVTGTDHHLANGLTVLIHPVIAAQESITQKTAEREALIHERDVGLGQLMKARFEDANVASADIHKRLTAISNIWGFVRCILLLCSCHSCSSSFTRTPCRSSLTSTPRSLRPRTM